jgi:hypothetical protein
MKKNWIFAPFLPLFALLLLLATAGNSARTPQGTLPTDAAPSVLPQSVTTPSLSDRIDFAGERLPLQNFDVRESLQRELTVISYWHASLLYTLQLSRRFFPLIEPILKDEGVPDDFKYLCVAESNLQQLVSPAKAVGFWQFLEGTAKEYGLEINSEIDERYHIEKATRAACAYLKKAYGKYGSWAMAAASYNVGHSNLDRQIARQKQTLYYDLLLPEETGRYVFRAVAFKMVMSRPALYGVHVNSDHLFAPLQWDDANISGAVESWADFAAVHGTNYKIFKYFNPWLRDTGLANAAKKTYVVKIPKKGFRDGGE